MLLARVWFVGLVLAACGDDGGGPSQDAAPPPIDVALDAPAVCAVANECPCFSNDDCPDSTRCHAEDETHVFCTPGPRGTGAAGTVCTGEDDCASALCVEGENDVLRCSKICTDNAQCPAELPRCLGGIGICARDL
ncbi:MAG: hypothetical protein ABI867_22065 [Kofleriaceae bacterium]